MTITTEQLLNDLIESTISNIQEVQSFTLLSTEKLNYKISKESWSILECIAHLNLYGDFYIPEITKRMQKSNSTPRLDFKSGYLGNYFAEMMIPKVKPKKMKTFKIMNPLGSALDTSTLTRFIAQQNQILELLNQARLIDLQKIKTSISISKLIKLKLGDTFRVVIYHNQRHISQANKIVALKFQ